MFSYATSPTCWLILVGCFSCTLLLTPIVMFLATKWKIIDTGGYRKVHRRSVPLLGGLAIAIPFLGLCVLATVGPTSMLALLASRHDEIVRFAVCALLVLTLGLLDDMMHLGAKFKFAAQFVICLLYCLSGSNVVQVIVLPLYGQIDLGYVLGTVLTVLWLAGLMNAFNLVDGVDGLATSLALISAAGLGVISAMNGAIYVLVMSLGLVGCLSAFLIFNFYPAKIFLGDTGSLFLGFVLAAMAIAGASRSSGAAMLATPMMVLALPIFDTLTSMARRILRGHDPFFGDRRHTHHRLLGRGLSQRQVALLMGGVSLLCTVAAIFAQTFHAQRREFTLFIGLAAVLLIGVAWLNGYLKLRHAVRLVQCRNRNSRLSAISHYATLSLSSSDSRVKPEEIFRLMCKELGLDFLDIYCPGKDEHLWRFENTKDPSKEERPEKIESVQVNGADQEALVIRYRLAHCHIITEVEDEGAGDEDRLEHEDVAACLVRLFSKAKLWPKKPKIRRVKHLRRPRHHFARANGAPEKISMPE